MKSKHHFVYNDADNIPVSPICKYCNVKLYDIHTKLCERRIFNKGDSDIEFYSKYYPCLSEE